MNPRKIIDFIVNNYLAFRMRVFGHILLRHNRMKELRAIVRAEEVMEPDLVLNGNNLTKHTLLEHFVTKHPWGDYHPDNKNQYWDGQAVYVDSRGQIRLDVEYKPITVGKDTHLYNIGLLHGKKAYKEAFFTVKAKLPKGGYLWPAIWLYNNWPPEVDILEYYSAKDKKGAETNLHYGPKETVRHLGAYNYGELPAEFIDYSCLYVPKKYIKIYYNGHLVRQITDPKVLLWYIGEYTKLTINNGMSNAALADPITTFIVSEIEIWKPKNSL